MATGKCQPFGPPLQWETWQALFPIGILDPRVGIFLSPLNISDRVCLFLHHVSIILKLSYVTVFWNSVSIQILCIFLPTGHLDHVTVLIGIAVKGKATAGIINQPFYDFKNISPHGEARCIWGVLGLGR